ncbi:hypothetical protein ABVT39_002691 [Epinephelus coioides]
MGRVKKGSRAQRKDLWAMAGGMEALVRSMKSVNITNRGTEYTSEIWSELSVTLFGQDQKKNRHWLWVIWTRKRKGVRDLTIKQQDKTKKSEEDSHARDLVSDEDTEENEAEELQAQEVTDEDSHKDEEEDKQQEMSLQTGVQLPEVTDEDSHKDEEEEDEQQEMSLQTGVQLQEVTDEDSHKDEEEDKQQKMPLQTGARPKHVKTWNRKQWRKLPVVSKRFTITLLLKPMLPKDLTQSQEGWAKRDGAKPQTASSKCYTAPTTIPVPKRAKSTLNTGKDLQESADGKNSSNVLTRKGSTSATEVEALWTCKPTEVVVAVVRHAEQKNNYTLRHREFQSLRPDELIVGEVIECYIRAILNSKDTAGRLYLMNHYTVGTIVHGTREQMARQGLKKVTFDDYDGAIGFVNIRNVHRKFVFQRMSSVPSVAMRTCPRLLLMLSGFSVKLAQNGFTCSALE